MALAVPCHLPEQLQILLKALFPETVRGKLLFQPGRYLFGNAQDNLPQYFRLCLLSQAAQRLSGLLPGPLPGLPVLIPQGIGQACDQAVHLAVA